MKKSSVISFIARHGREAMRAKEREKKRRQRAQLRLDAGEHHQSTAIVYDGVVHPHWCLCYDCQWGAIADIKRIRRGLAPVPVSLDEDHVHRHDLGARGSRFPGTGHIDY